MEFTAQLITGRCLIAYATGLSARPDDKAWRNLVLRLKQEPELRGWAWLPLPHDTNPLTLEEAEHVAARMNDKLCAEFTKNKGLDEIILIGHSAGALFLRMAYAINAGWISGEPVAARWSAAVRRFVLMAALNRGLDSGRAPRARFAARASRALRVLGLKTLIYDLLKGSDFVTNLRLLWLRHLPSLHGRLEIPHVLGEDDQEVTREDCIDTEQFPDSFHIPVPDADHVRLHDLSSTSDPEGHYKLLLEAIIGDSTHSKPPNAALHEARTAFVNPPSQKEVFFLLHGIRSDRLGWVNSVKGLLKKHDTTIPVKTPSHGFYTALRFAIPFLHRSARRIIQDAYSQAVAEHPTAIFHAAAHSNGTYILTQALDHIEAMHFARVMLGGCVLPIHFDWRRLANRKQVQQVRHDFTKTDGIVAVLCSALKGAGRRDIGTAGYNSFTSMEEWLNENQLPDGGHNAAFDSPEDHNSIARFLLGLEGPQRLDAGPARKPIPRIVSRLSENLWLAFVLLTVSVGVIGWSSAGPVGAIVGVFILFSSIAYLLDIL
jgi:hypothetical protein